MEIRLPKRSIDLRMKHLKAMDSKCLNPDEFADISLEDIFQFISDFTGEHVNDIRMILPDDIWKIYRKIVELYSGIYIGQPAKEIIVEGKEYSLIDPHKVGSGWHADWDGVLKSNDLIKRACMMYYPKGIKYGVTDENKNLIYPIRSRYRSFERDLPLEVYLNASAFFLRKYERSMRLYTAKLITTKKTVQFLQRIIGKRSLT